MGDGANEQDRWVPLGRPSWWMPIVLASPLIVVLLVVNALNVSMLFLRDLPLGWLILVMIAVAAAAYVLTLTVIWLAYPRAYVNPAIATVRAGRRRARYAQITSAKLLASASKRRRSLNLLLRSDRGLRAVVLVRDARERTLDPSTTALVRAVILGSTIAMPTSPDDPKGRFAKYNFPDNVTREEALELIEHPPLFGEPVPIPPRV